jgi:hypothetical protein
LDPTFPNQNKGREQFESIIDNMDLITDLWEGNLVVLEEFGVIEDGNDYSLECQPIGFQEWQQIEHALNRAAQLLFVNHINDLYDDWDYEGLVKPILEQRRLGFSDFFNLELSLQDGPICFGHSKLMVLHLISLLENAIEAADFTRAADQFKQTRTIDDQNKNLISYRLRQSDGFALVEVQNDCRVQPEEEEKLVALGAYIRTFSIDGPMIHHNKHLAERTFTTKSGTGFGWAVILAADYFCRLRVVDADGIKKERGKFSIEVLRDDTPVPTGVRATISLPLPKNEFERVVVEK